MRGNGFTVSPAYQGITGIAHGGYVAGLFVRGVVDRTRVTLRRPPPLDVPLAIEADRLVDADGRTVMEAGVDGGPDGASPIVALEEARSRSPHPRFATHPYPDCFMCGTARDDGFGLRVSAPGDDGVAAGVWEPSGPLLNDGETVAPEFVWAAVDCLTVWGFADRWEDPEWWPALTGQIAVHTLAPVRRDRSYVAAARLVGREGRKITVDAAITDEDGELCARGSAVWIVVAANP